MRPSSREKQIIVWLCVNSVCQSAERTSCPYPGRLALGRSKCASRALACKLHLGNPTCALWARAQLITNHESTRPRSTSVHLLLNVVSRIVQLFTNTNCSHWPLGLRFAVSRGLCLKIVIWLILPVVICLSQRLTHACLSISFIRRNCEWLIKTVIVYLIIKFTWITVVILELIHAVMPDFLEGRYLLDNNQYSSCLLWWFIITFESHGLWPR